VIFIRGVGFSVMRKSAETVRIFDPMPALRRVCVSPAPDIVFNAGFVDAAMLHANR
jgi:hypothetical protein